MFNASKAIEGRRRGSEVVNPVRKGGDLNPTLPACRQAGIRNEHFFLHPQTINGGAFYGVNHY